MRLRQLVLGAGLLALVLVVQGRASAITVNVNGTPLPATPPAVQRQGRVLLPLRVVFEALGAQVSWLAATQTVTATRGDRTVQMTINGPTASINEKPVALDVPAQLIEGSTYVPVRFPAEALGADVRWDQPTQTVFITQQGAPAPPPPPPATTPTPPEVSVEPQAPLTPGQSLLVTVQGQPGAQASADLGTLFTSVPLPEVEAGTYAVELVIPTVTARQSLTLTVHLRAPDGKTSTAMAPQPVVLEPGSR